MSEYKSAVCDLCGNAGYEVLIKSGENRSMTSDQRITERELYKIRCTQCGLIREGNDFSYAALDTHYRHDYQLNKYEQKREHQFFIGGRQVARSLFIAEWIRDTFAAAGIAFPGAAFEVGAGEGLLMKQLQELFPATTFAGCELSEGAAALGRASGLDVVCGGTEAITKTYPLIYNFGVFEHVPSPKTFIRELAERVEEGGFVLIGQPIQDVEGYDIFFSDHLHHFHSAHIPLFAAEAGLVQLIDFRSGFIPNFAMHLLQKQKQQTPLPVQFIPTPAVDATLEHWKKAFEKVKQLPKEGKQYAFFGVGEVATLLFAHGGLGDLPLLLALDDFPERHNGVAWNLPVKRLDMLTETEKQQIDAVIVTLRSAYQETVRSKCAAAGLHCIPIFD